LDINQNNFQNYISVGGLKKQKSGNGKKFNLRLRRKRQPGICFLGRGRFERISETLYQAKKGKVLNEVGEQ